MFGAFKKKTKDKICVSCQLTVGSNHTRHAFLLQGGHGVCHHLPRHVYTLQVTHEGKEGSKNDEGWS